MDAAADFSARVRASPYRQGMSRQRQWDPDRKSYGLRAWRKAWAKTSRRRRDRDAADEDSTTAADIAIQEPSPRVIPDEGVPEEVREFLAGGGLERWAERERQAREQHD
jgi:hypothetical protein